MNPSTRILLQNVENEFTVPLTVSTLPEPQCLMEVFQWVWQGLMGQGEVRVPQSTLEVLLGEKLLMGQDAGGRLSGFPTTDRALRRHPKSPFVASATAPGPWLSSWPHRDLVESRVPQADTLSDWFLHTGGRYPTAAGALFSRFLIIASRTYSRGRHVLYTSIFSDISALGQARQIEAVPHGDLVFMEGGAQIDTGQRQLLMDAIVALMRGEQDWSQASDIFLSIDDMNEPILYELSCTLTAILRDISSAAFKCFIKMPGEKEAVRAIEKSHEKGQDDVGKIAEMDERLKAFYASSGMLGRRWTSPTAWDFLLRLLVALAAPLPLCVVTFPYPTSSKIPRQADWRPLWDQDEYYRHAQVLANFDLLKYEDIDPLYRPVSRFKASWKRFLGQPQKPTFPRFIMAQMRELPTF